MKYKIELNNGATLEPLDIEYYPVVNGIRFDGIRFRTIYSSDVVYLIPYTAILAIKAITCPVTN